MKPRLIILLILALGLGVWFATKSPDSQSGGSTAPSAEDTTTDPTAEARKVELTEIDLPGAEPADPAQFSVKVEVDVSSGKNRLVFYINEKHGYFVETMTLRLWYTPTGKDIDPKDSPLQFTHYINDYMQAKQTYKGHLEVVPAELSQVGGKIGSSENWRAEVTKHHRAREADPSKLPVRPGEHP